MKKMRSEELFRTKERSRNTAAMRKFRKVDAIREEERERNSSRMRITRQNANKRKLEQAKNSSSMRITRQNANKRKLEQAKNSSRMRVTRQQTARRELERAKNVSRMKMVRQKSATRQFEATKNLARMRLTRQATIYRNLERTKNLSRMRIARQEPSKKAGEQAINTRRRKEIRKMTEVKPNESKFQNKRAQVAIRQPDKILRVRKNQAQKKARARRSDVFRKRESDARKKYRKGLQEETLEVKLQKFKEKSKEGPTCICTCCGSLWFRSSVHSLSTANLESKHSPEFLEKILNLSCSEAWICRTCYIYVQKGQVPRLAISNGLDFPKIPDVLKNLTTLEERLVALRLPFLQIRSLGVDRQCGMKGNVVHIPNDIDTSVSCIPRAADEASVIPVVLVRKLDHQKPYLFQMVRPEKIYEAAKYLVTTPVYEAEGATLSLGWLNEANGLKSKLNNSDKSIEDIANISQDDRLKNDNMETMIVQYGSDAIKVAPGQGKQPMSLLMDIVADEAAYPTIYGGQRRSVPANVTVHEIWKSECRRYDRR